MNTQGIGKQTPSVSIMAGEPDRGNADEFSTACTTQRLRAEAGMNLSEAQVKARIAGRLEALSAINHEVSKMMKHNASPRPGDWPYRLEDVRVFIKERISAEIASAFAEPEKKDP